ncbi:MAG TPA: hypothetical protein DCM05_01875 [Elusimicrobia bacterium]|nr:hypothetical protein [Elusimicrobiota bacterium]
MSARPSSKRVRVAHVVTLLEYGGAQQNTLHTVAHLDAQRFEPLLACGRGGLLDPAAVELDRTGRCRLRFLPDLVREISPLRDLSAFFQLYSWLRAERPAIVHTHSSKAGVLGRLAARLAGVPVIIHTFHGFGFHGRQPLPVRETWVSLEKLCASVSDSLVFVSRANMDYAASQEVGERGAYELIRSGVSLSRLPARADPGALRRAFGFPAGCPLVVSVGNLKPQKNAGDFLRLASLVLMKRPDARFLFVGDGELRRRLEEAAARAGLEGKLVFAGWRKDVPELLAASDLFVLTSLWEGLPRALVEAMKSGLPCACYATDGVVDVLTDGRNGFTAPQGDWEGLAAKALALLDDEDLRRRLGRAASESIGPEFDIDDMVRRQEELYEKLLKRARLEA